MKKRFENHRYETNLTLTSETNLELISENNFDKHITVLEYIKNKNVKVLYIMDENYIIYCPDIKFEFYKKCDQEFTEKYFGKIKEFHKWLKILIQ